MRLNFLLIIIIIFGISGCASLQDQIKHDRELMATPYYDGSDKVDPLDTAGFYASQYPDCTNNEKAEMLCKTLKGQGYRAELVETTRTVVDKSVMLDGKKVWPVQIIKRNEACKLQEIDTLGGKHMTIDQAEGNN